MNNEIRLQDSPDHSRNPKRISELAELAALVLGMPEHAPTNEATAPAQTVLSERRK